MLDSSSRIRVLLQPLAFGLAVVGVLCLVALSPAESQAEDGAWTCYVADRLPDAEGAADWGGSKKLAEGLNKIASHVSSGEILVLEVPIKKSPGFGDGSSGSPSVICVKG